jgi:hypothetical protein
MNTYSQTTGEIFRAGLYVGSGYSGHADGKNNPAMQNVRDVGPIPQGRWKIVELIEDHPTLGHYVLRLAPCEGTNTFGRSDFYIHGDNTLHMGNSSHGCIVAPPAARLDIWESGNRDLLVTV